MKKKRLLSVVALSALVAFGGISTMVSCGPGDEQTETQTYTVSYATSSDYTVTGLASSYKEGDTVTFTVTPATGKLVDTVTANGTALAAGANNQYSFQMGSTNVTLVITVKDAVTHTLTAEANGDWKVGSTVTVVARVDGSIIADFTVEATTGADLVTVSGNSVTCNAAGEVVLTVSATYEGTALTATVGGTITDPADDYISLKDIKALNGVAVGDTVTFRAEVIASGGTSAYLSDGVDSIYVYNWSYNSDDSAISNRMWTVGQEVEVCGIVQEDSYNEGLIRINNYSDGRVDGTYAHALETNTITPLAPIEVDEAGIKALQVSDVGKMYTFDATYVSGTPVSDKAVSVYFKVGGTDYILRTDGGSSKMYDRDIQSLIDSFDALDLVEGKPVKITAPLSWYGGNPQFGYISHGTTIEVANYNDPTAITLSASDTNVQVGSQVTLSHTFTGENAWAPVTYSIVSGDAYATLSDDTLSFTSGGTVEVKATATLKDGTKLDSNTVSIVCADFAGVLAGTYEYNPDYQSDGSISGSAYSKRIDDAEDALTAILGIINNTTATTNSLITEVTAAERIYYNATEGTTVSGWRFSTGSANGSLSFNLSSPVIRLELQTIGWKNDAEVIAVNGDSDSYSGTAADGITIETSIYDFATATSTITMQATKRAAVVGMKFYTAPVAA